MSYTLEPPNSVNELQKKVNELVKSIEDYKNQAEAAKEVAEQARSDCQSQMKLMQDIQEKYERELMLHAQDMQTMTTLKKEYQNCSSKFEKLAEATKIAEQALVESRESWSRQENIFVKETEALKIKLKELEECNRNLHEQLDLDNLASNSKANPGKNILSRESVLRLKDDWDWLILHKLASQYRDFCKANKKISFDVEFAYIQVFKSFEDVKDVLAHRPVYEEDFVKVKSQLVNDYKNLKLRMSECKVINQYNFFKESCWKMLTRWIPFNFATSQVQSEEKMKNKDD